MYGYQDKIRYFLLSYIFILVSSIACAEKTHAEATLNAPVETSCTVEKLKDGKLGVNGNNDTLDSSIGNGESGLVSIDCNSSVKVEITKPVKSGGTGTTTFTGSGDTLFATAKNTNLGLDIASNGTFSKDILDTEEDGSVGKITVDMKAKKSSGSISAGEYKFTVTLTVTPQ